MHLTGRRILETELSARDIRANTHIMPMDRSPSAGRRIEDRAVVSVFIDFLQRVFVGLKILMVNRDSDVFLLYEASVSVSTELSPPPPAQFPFDLTSPRISTNI